MAIRTRLTVRLNIEHPILNAPMGGAAGGKLAAADLCVAERLVRGDEPKEGVRKPGGNQ